MLNFTSMPFLFSPRFSLANAQKKLSTKSRSDQINSILTRFEQNPTLTSSTFPSVSAPTLVLKILSHDRSVLKRQAYFLDYLDPTTYPHLPGSTLFPDPCTYLDPLPLEPYFQATSDENLLITKMVTICHRLYDNHVWLDGGRFSDMWDIFRLPSLYPQYVFLTQIPLDLMLVWHKYHHDKRMEQTSTTSKFNYKEWRKSVHFPSVTNLSGRGNETKFGVITMRRRKEL